MSYVSEGIHAPFVLLLMVIATLPV